MLRALKKEVGRIQLTPEGGQRSAEAFTSAIEGFIGPEQLNEFLSTVGLVRPQRHASQKSGVFLCPQPPDLQTIALNDEVSQQTQPQHENTILALIKCDEQ